AAAPANLAQKRRPPAPPSFLTQTTHRPLPLPFPPPRPRIPPPAFLSARAPRHHRARPRQGRLRGRGYDLDAAACAERAAVTGGGNPAAHPALPGRAVGLHLPPPMEYLESQGAAARRGSRGGRGLAVRCLCADRLCGDRGRRDRHLLCPL